MEYRLIRSKRKTIAIKISLDNGIEVRVPLKASKEDIMKVIKDNEGWIKKTYEKIKKEESKAIDLKYETGEKIYFLGKEIGIEVKEDSKCAISFNGEKFLFKMEGDVLQVPHKREQMGRELYIAYLRQAGKRYLELRTRELAAQYGFEVNIIKIKNIKSRWGSCSTKNNINLNLRLMMADKKVIDYVIIHELCHTIEMNHSQNFWKLVESVIPDYKQRERYLKEMALRFRL